MHCGQAALGLGSAAYLALLFLSALFVRAWLSSRRRLRREAEAAREVAERDARDAAAYAMFIECFAARKRGSADVSGFGLTVRYLASVDCWFITGEGERSVTVDDYHLHQALLERVAP